MRGGAHLLARLSGPFPRSRSPVVLHGAVRQQRQDEELPPPSQDARSKPEPLSVETLRLREAAQLLPATVDQFDAIAVSLTQR